MEETPIGYAKQKPKIAEGKNPLMKTSGLWERLTISYLGFDRIQKLNCHLKVTKKNNLEFHVSLKYGKNIPHIEEKRFLELGNESRRKRPQFPITNLDLKILTIAEILGERLHKLQKTYENKIQDAAFYIWIFSPYGM